MDLVKVVDDWGFPARRILIPLIKSTIQVSTIYFKLTGYSRRWREVVAPLVFYNGFLKAAAGLGLSQIPCVLVYGLEDEPVDGMCFDDIGLRYSQKQPDTEQQGKQ